MIERLDNNAASGSAEAGPSSRQRIADVEEEFAWQCEAWVANELEKGTGNSCDAEDILNLAVLKVVRGGRLVLYDVDSHDGQVGDVDLDESRVRCSFSMEALAK